MAANECIPLYEEGEAVTAKATAAVTGKRVVDISGEMDGPRQAGLSDTVDGSNINCAHAGAGTRGIGVSSYDAPSGGKFYVLGEPGMILPITAGAAIAAGAEVEVGATGKVITKNTGVAIGKAIDACAASGTDLDCFVKLY